MRSLLCKLPRLPEKIPITPEQALKRVIFEGADSDGMVVEVRAGNNPGRERVNELFQALKTVEMNLRGDYVLDRKLAFALYGLTFHMSASLEGWEKCEWIDDYVRILNVIESIFEGDSYDEEE